MKYILAILFASITASSYSAQVQSNITVTATIKYDCSSSKLEEMKSVPAYAVQCSLQQNDLLKNARISTVGNVMTIEY
ncbi:MAG TPA: hypothetical protein VM577_03485 [Anaerovoracaceae bacterium]|nr:hypothetical protein [Anaerovoracaceae bacterium]